ncbi:hypothetical protein [Paenibacillus cremeus]|uniref:Glycosyl transferase n=1 Tax=Paenibacillus cremeus TaxID=2163881 RepID=A0A559KI64_9BACL|nr:hypothetical protein [Paenibacillus cremeus]TVY11830.1 hypothetical protein FPZ49_00615 [Paenibacillus cremeus]
MILCTMTTAGHLYRAKVMAQSAKRHHPQARVVVCLVEAQMHSAAASDYFDQVVLAGELGIPRFRQLVGSRNVHEASFVLKGHFLKYLLRTYPEENQFIFLDTDTLVLSAFDEIEEVLQTHAVVLTPHELFDQKKVYLFHGIFNIGFIALNRSEEAARFLEWWTARGDRYCYDRYLSGGIFFEQNWLNLAPAYFQVHILRHPGYNVAFWNFGERGRSIVRAGDGRYYANDVPIRFFHFSKLSGALVKAIKRHTLRGNRALSILRSAYIRELNAMGRKGAARFRWSFGKSRTGRRKAAGR